MTEENLNLTFQHCPYESLAEIGSVHPRLGSGSGPRTARRLRYQNQSPEIITAVGPYPNVGRDFSKAGQVACLMQGRG